MDQLFAELLCKPISAENISNTNILAHISNIIIGMNNRLFYICVISLDAVLFP